MEIRYSRGRPLGLDPGTLVRVQAGPRNLPGICPELRQLRVDSVQPVPELLHSLQLAYWGIHARRRIVKHKCSIE